MIIIVICFALQLLRQLYCKGGSRVLEGGDKNNRGNSLKKGRGQLENGGGNSLKKRGTV